MKRSLVGYMGEEKYPFIKITVNQNNQLNNIKRVITNGLVLPGLRPFSDMSFESNIAYTLRFMIDNKVWFSYFKKQHDLLDSWR